MSSVRSTADSRRPIIFLGVGALNTLLDFLFYTFLTQTFFKDDNIALAGIISGTFALACAFITHSLITWRGTNVGHKTVLKFVAFTGFGMWVLRPLLLSLFAQLDGLYQWAYSISDSIGLPLSESFVANTGAFGLMIIFLLIYNFFVYDRFVFNDNPANLDD